MDNTTNWRPALLVLTVALACLLGAVSSFAQATVAAASVPAPAGSTCTLAPKGSDGKGIRINAEPDGVARFYARKLAAGDPAHEQSLTCTDRAGKTTTAAVDLAAASTFVARPRTASGTARPALSGDPLQMSQADLVARGYGLRPDPKASPDAYARWLAAAQKPGTLVADDHPLPHHFGTITTGTDAPWTGPVLTGSAPYVASEATFNVPNPQPGADGTTATEISIWTGVGGSVGAGLIQNGIFIDTTANSASINAFQEYCCGDANQTSGGSFSPSAGDTIFVQAWYCDSKGNTNIAGGYGCTFTQDLTTNQIMSCTVAGGSPCGSVKANVLCSVRSVANCFTLGTSAEYIIENDSGETGVPGAVQFTPFSGTVTMPGSAATAANGHFTETFSNDPTVRLLLDWTNTTTRILATLASPNKAEWRIEPGSTAFVFYCQGPLQTSSGLDPQTGFTWAAKGAGAVAPGEGQCAWADRAPRGTEIKAGNRNTLVGFLNGEANLPAGKFMALDVYRDPAQDNDLVITKVVGPASPPFSTNPTAK